MGAEEDIELRGAENSQPPSQVVVVKSSLVWKIAVAILAFLCIGILLVLLLRRNGDDKSDNPIGQDQPESFLPPLNLGKDSEVGFISPGYPPLFYWDAKPRNATYTQHVEDSMRSLGLTGVLAPNALKTNYGYLAGTDEQRVADIHSMFETSSIKAIIANRGGYGCNRLLDMIDYDKIKANPKPLMGYSDLTGLINAVHAKTGLVTFHGPMGVGTWNGINGQKTLEIFAGKLGSGDKIALSNSAADPGWGSVRTIRSGKATGKLIGGNLSVLAALVGTPYLPSLKGAILFLEDVGERAYSIDRMLATFARAGHLKELAGFVWGTCEACDPRDASREFTIDEVLDQYILPLNIPAIKGLAFGHIDEQIVVPVGAMATLDGTSLTVTL